MGEDSEQLQPLAAAEICFYNEVRTIGKNLESLMLGELFDYAICVDGPFPGYPGAQKSDDGSREVIKSFKNTILVDMPAEEYFKRELACHICRNLGCMFILIIDADEFLIRRNVKQFRRGLEKILESGSDRNIFGINYCMGYPDQFSDKPRLWYKPWEVEYIRGSHWRFKNMFHNKYYDKAIQGDRWNQVVEGIVIRHESEPRGKEREKIMYNYQQDIKEPFERSLDFDKIEFIEK